MTESSGRVSVVDVTDGVIEWTADLADAELGDGTATCDRMASIDVGHPVRDVIIDSGRLTLSTDDGHIIIQASPGLVAYGLPG